MSEQKYLDSFRAITPLGNDGVHFFSLQALESAGFGKIGRFPRSLRVILESVLRSENGQEITLADIEAFSAYDPRSPADIMVGFMPTRVLLQDFTGVPCVVDLAAMRTAVARLGGDPAKINPRIPVDLVIDHSVQIDYFGDRHAFAKNTALEFERNRERYEFLAWGQSAFGNFRVVPPASGICHQVNLEYLSEVVREADWNAKRLWFADTVVGTDSHTPMINGLGVVGWGVGGIEAEAVMLGQPLYMLTPAVVGFRLTGNLPEGTTATDLILKITEVLRKHGVVDKFVEFVGPGVASLSVPDRATIANMSPEGGSTIGYFPVDARVLSFLERTGRGHLVGRVEAYSRAQGLFVEEGTPDPDFAEMIELDLATVRPAISGPKRPQDRVELGAVKSAWRAGLVNPAGNRGFGLAPDSVEKTVDLDGVDGQIGHGSVVLASITSCTNTSNPSVMLSAGLLARNARLAGLAVKPWVKTSLAPGSTVVTEYLERAGLLEDLEAMNFHVVGYGCATCIGNSGPLPEPVTTAIEDHDLVVAGVLSGNRNFEGRINPHIKANYLASPPLVVAYAIAGTVDIDLTSEPLGIGSDGRPVYLSDVWPTNSQVANLLESATEPDIFLKKYNGIEKSNPDWNAIPIRGGDLYDWSDGSTYILEPPFFADVGVAVGPLTPIRSARALVMVGDSVTTDHISPASSIPAKGPAGQWLMEHGVSPDDFNSFGARRGNDRVMTRGTFANIRLRNLMAPGTEGGFTTQSPNGEVMSVFSCAQRYREAGTPTIVIAGRDYGMGSSRDWAAKGTLLLGVRAVIAKSFERIHRSNLVGMGVLPLEFLDDAGPVELGLTGWETFEIDVSDDVQPGDEIEIRATSDDGKVISFNVLCRLDSRIEVDYYRNGGILNTVLRGMLR